MAPATAPAEKKGRSAGETSGAESSSNYGIAGFDADLLDVAVLSQQLKKLPRALMIAALQRGLVAVKVNALHTLQLHGSLTPSEVLTAGAMLKDESPSVRGAAARTLATATDPLLAVALLCSATNDRNDAVRSDVLRAIETVGAAALPALIAELDCDPEVADRNVLPHLARHGDKAVKPLVTSFDHDSERVRANAVAGLMALGPTVLVQHEAAVAKLLNDSAVLVTKIARQAMNAIYRHCRPEFLVIEAPPSPHFGSQALTEAETKKFAKTDLRTLHHYAKDGRKTARLNAWRCIEAAGGTLDDYTTALALVALKDGEPEVQAQATRVVTRCPDDRLHDVVYGLVRCALDSDPEVREATWAAFDAMSKRTLPTLIDQIGERDLDCAQQVVFAIARHEAKAAKPLYKTLNHIGPIERWNALLALIEIGGKTLESAHGELRGMLREPFDSTRAMVVRALGKLPKLSKADPDVVAAIQHMLEYDASLAVRTEADKALRVITGT